MTLYQIMRFVKDDDGVLQVDFVGRPDGLLEDVVVGEQDELCLLVHGTGAEVGTHSATMTD